MATVVTPGKMPAALLGLVDLLVGWDDGMSYKQLTSMPGCWNTLPRTNVRLAPENIFLNPKGTDHLNQPLIIRGKLAFLVSGRVYFRDFFCYPALLLKVWKM